MSEERFAYLQDVVTWSPSKRTWKTIKSCFELWPQGEERKAALIYASERLNHWDSVLRIAEFHDGHPCWPLVTHWDIPEEISSKRIQNILSFSRHITYLTLSFENLVSTMDVLSINPHIDSLCVKGERVESAQSAFCRLPHLKRLFMSSLFEKEDLSPFAELLNLQTFRAGFSHFHLIKDIGTLKQLPHLEELQLPNCSSLDNLRSLEGLHRLKKLSIRKLSNSHDLKVLSELKNLRTLTLFEPNEVQEEDVSSLTQLEELSIDYDFRRSLELLAPLKNLRTLELEGCGRLESLWGIGALSSLKKLKIASTFRLRDISGLEKLMKLRALSIRAISHVKDLSAIRTSQHLRELIIHIFNEEKARAFLPENGLLVQLYLAYCPILRCLDGIQENPHLFILYLKGLERVEEIPNIHSFKELRYLSIVDCPLLKESKSFKNLSLAEYNC